MARGRNVERDDSRPVVETRGLSKRYGSVTALDALDLEIPRTALGLLGPNGAGKSTLIKLLLGLVRPTTGTGSVLGLDIQRDAVQVRQRVGYMPESDCLPGDVTAADFVGHMAEISGLPSREARLRAAEVLYQCGVDEERYRLIREFSTGMKQRVKLAQAVVHDPDVVFLDEPTNGMDPAGRADMLRLISRIHREVGITVVLSSHLLEDVEQVCQHVVMLDGGRLVGSGPVASLLQSGGAIMVEVDGEADAFARWLEASGATLTRQGNHFVIDYSDDTTFDLVRDAAAGIGAGLRSLRVQSRTLEDVYLQQLGAPRQGVGGRVESAR